MADISRRNLFAAGAAGAAGLAVGAGTATTAAAQAARAPASNAMPARVGLPNVWGEDFLYQWSPPENYVRNTTPGPNTIRLSGQTSPRLTNAPGTDYASLFKRMHDEGWSAVEAGSAAWMERKLPETELREIKTQAAANDIVFYGLHCAGNIIAPDPDADRWQRHIIDSIRAAEELGCELILTHAGSMHPNRNVSHPQNWSKECWDRTVNALKRICRDTAGSKIEIAIEAVNTESINSPWAQKRLREDVGDERITCGLDITNMVDPSTVFRMSEFIDTTFDLIGDQIRYVHGKDLAWNSMLAGLNWTMQGTGNMDYELFLARVSRLTKTTMPYVLIEFLTNNDEYEQAQRNVRAIADKIGVKIYGTQPPPKAA
jgi:sugar phosphate isomerase/epimerase